MNIFTRLFAKSWLTAIVLAAVAAVGATHLQGTSTPQRRPPRGIIVEEVGDGSVSAGAGIRPGDQLQTWVRSANPPANPAAARGELRTAFDVSDVETEQAPRGPVTIKGLRGGKSFSATLSRGPWGIRARPVLVGSVQASFLEGKKLVEKKELEQGLSRWRGIAMGAGERHQTILAAWMLSRVAEVLVEANRHTEASAAFDQALQAATGPRNRSIAATIWQRKGRFLRERNPDAESEAALREALRIRQILSPDSLAVASVWHDLGLLAWARGDLAASEDQFKRALAIRQQLAATSIEAAASLNNLGNVAASRGQPDEAETLYQQALAIREAIEPRSLEVAASFNNLGNLADDRGDLDSAQRFREQALALVQTLAPGSLDESHILHNLANVAGQRADLPAAEALSRRALAIREARAPDSLVVAESLNGLTAILGDRGDLASAQNAQSRALAIYQRLAPDSLAEADSLNNLGIVARLRGDLAAAQGFDERALALRRKRAPGSLDEAMSLNNLGITALARGDLAEAEALYRSSLDIKEKLAPGSLNVAATWRVLGTTARKRGDTKAAQAFQEQALAISRRQAPGSLDVARSLSALGNLALDGGELASARQFFEESFAIRERLAPGGLELAESLTQWGELAVKQGDMATAEASFQKALGIEQLLAPGSTDVAQTFYRLASIYLSQERPDALDLFRQAVEALESQTARLGGADEVRSGFVAQHAEYYDAYIRALLDLDQPALAFQVLERSRARSLLTMLAERDLAFKADVPPALMRERKQIDADYDRTQAALAEKNPASDAQDIETLARRLRELRDAREAIARQIRTASPRFAALQYPQPLDLNGTRATLDAGTVLLSYAVGKDRTQLFVVQPNGVRTADLPGLSVFAIPVGEEALRQQVAAFRDLIGRREPDLSSKTAIHQAGERLYTLLVEPAEALIGAADRVLIAPDGPLHSFPFGALVRPSVSASGAAPPRYFTAWKPLHTIVSATVYAEVRKERPERSAPGETVLAAFGDPLYPATRLDRERLEPADAAVRALQRRGYTLEPLPETRREVEAIARLYGGVATTYLGADATEERAKAIGTEVRYLHFAAHGLVDEHFPLNSSLALSMPSTQGQGEENGLLQAWEIFEHLRIDADLVTLSACETALGKEMGGEGLLGLTRAFQYAGARTVLASLWEVDDQSTAELMTRFYGYLKAGMAKDEALRAAQLDLLQSERFPSPFHWAAFTLTGNWR